MPTGMTLLSFGLAMSMPSNANLFWGLALSGHQMLAKGAESFGRVTWHAGLFFPYQLMSGHQFEIQRLSAT